MRYLLLALIFLHGGIHLLGFLEAFQLAGLQPLSVEIGRPMGLLWLFATLLFFLTGLAYALRQSIWPPLLIGTVLLSQLLLFILWKEAKFGTLPNFILLLVALIALGMQRFEHGYRHSVKVAMAENIQRNRIIMEKDLQPLPLPVQRYLRYAGVVGKPMVYNMRVVFEGEMRKKDEPWFDFNSEQYNFFDLPSRFFFMKAWVKGLPAWGFHAYTGDKASMLVKILGWIPVVRLRDSSLFPTETVTYFNDLCLFAPAALLDKRIRWETIDSLSARAVFSNQGARISAVLSFNEQGQLTNFLSQDREDVNENKKIPFSTPVRDYKACSGFNLPGYGEGIWKYPGGDFVYGKFNVISVHYNLTELL